MLNYYPLFQCFVYCFIDCKVQCWQSRHYLARYTNSVNQIAKCVNSTSVIYNDDIKDLKNQIEHLSKEIWQIHSLLLDRTSNKDDV